MAATPSNSCGAILSAVEFRDELRDQYELGILDSPSHCDGCKTPFTTIHTLACKVGGLIHSRHDQNRDSIGCLACIRLQSSNVRDALLIRPCHDIGRKDESS